MWLHHRDRMICPGSMGEAWLIGKFCNDGMQAYAWRLAGQSSNGMTASSIQGSSSHPSWTPMISSTSVLLSRYSIITISYEETQSSTPPLPSLPCCKNKVKSRTHRVSASFQPPPGESGGWRPPVSRIPPRPNSCTQRLPLYAE